MNLTLIRRPSTQKGTIGVLSIDGQYECLTLEDVVRDVKIPKITAIPAGTYEVVISFSARFHKPLPLLLNVPEFVGIRIHPGNKPEDTEGCILVGRTEGPDWVGESHAAFDALFGKLQAAILREKIFIEITQEEKEKAAA